MSTSLVNESFLITLILFHFRSFVPVHLSVLSVKLHNVGQTRHRGTTHCGKSNAADFPKRDPLRVDTVVNATGLWRNCSPSSQEGSVKATAGQLQANTRINDSAVVPKGQHFGTLKLATSTLTTLARSHVNLLASIVFHMGGMVFFRAHSVCLSNQQENQMALFPLTGLLRHANGRLRPILLPRWAGGLSSGQRLLGLPGFDCSLLQARRVGFFEQIPVFQLSHGT